MARGHGRGYNPNEANTSESQPIIIAPFFTVSSGHHNNPPAAPAQAPAPAYLQAQLQAQAHAQAASQESNGGGIRTPQPRAAAQATAGNNEQGAGGGGQGNRGARRRRRRGAAQGNAPNPQPEAEHPPDERPPQTVRELASMIANGNPTRQQQREWRQELQAANVRPRGRARPLERSTRQKAEQDLRGFFRLVAQDATLSNIIHIFTIFLAECYRGTFDQGHIELWNEIVHAVLDGFTDDQQRVLRRMVI